MGIFLFIGIALLGVVAYLNIWLGRRKFNRRNDAGIEEFSGGYNGYLKTKAIEGAVFVGGVLTGLAGVTSILIGLIALTK